MSTKPTFPPSGTSADLCVELDGDCDLTEQILRARQRRGREEMDAQRAAIRAGNKHALPADVRTHRAMVAICPHARVVFVGCIGRGLACAYCGELHDHEIMSVLRLRGAGPDSGPWVGTQFEETVLPTAPSSRRSKG